MKSFLTLILFISITCGHPSPKGASKCNTSNCKIEDDCRCSSIQNPINNSNDPAPQLIALTVSESVVTNIYHDYLEPLLFQRKNPDGNLIGASFYVNHEYTDYVLVHDLYLRGFEIGVHSITKNSSQEYWRHATLEDLVQEFQGQRQIVSKFANIPIEDIVGARSPQLQLEGDLSIDAYIQSGIKYDNSWPTRSSYPLLPYTLDYVSTQECVVSDACPKQPHEHFWVAPITNIKGNNNIECNSFVACLIEGSPQEIASWLITQVDTMRHGNRAPLVLRLDSFWFQFTKNSIEGFTIFLNEMSKRSDVFFVSVGDVLKWIKNPVSAKNFRSSTYERYTDCRPMNCFYDFAGEHNSRYMNQCVGCPDVYPWKGNPYGIYRP